MAAMVPVHFLNVSNCCSEKLMTLQMSEICYRKPSRGNSVISEKSILIYILILSMILFLYFNGII